MKNLFIVLLILLVESQVSAQKWSSAFVGKPESKALYASNVAKAIQSAWENELSSKDKKEMLLDEIIFGQESEKKTAQELEISKNPTNNIDEIEEVLGIEEKIVEPTKKAVKLQSVNAENIVTSSVKDEKIKLLNDTEPVKKQLNNTKEFEAKSKTISIINDDIEMDTIYAIPQTSATFPGGTNAMKQFFTRNIQTPDNLGQAVKGKVFLRFVVDKYGKLSRVYLLKGLTEACNHEAMRVVKKMPSWIPATEDGKNVNSWYTLPIYFEID